MSNLGDLAEELSLSISTVSRALAGKPNVTEETRRRVLEAAERLGYAANRSGRSLRSGMTGTVTFILSPHPQFQYAEPFFMPLLGGLQEALAERSLDLTVALGRPGAAQVDQIRQLVESRSTDAVLLAWTQPNDPRIAWLIAAGVPFAALGRSEGLPPFPSLDIDFDVLGQEAAARLIGEGHRRLALVNAPADLNFHAYLERGFRRGLAAHGIPPEQMVLREDPMTEDGAHRLMQALLATPTPPTGMLLCGETMLAGAWRAFAEAGLRPGIDISVIMATDSPLCSFLSPRVTSFQAPLRELGSRLVEILMQAMPGYAGPEGRRCVQELVMLPLVARESDGPA